MKTGINPLGVRSHSDGRSPRKYANADDGKRQGPTADAGRLEALLVFVPQEPWDEQNCSKAKTMETLRIDVSGGILPSGKVEWGVSSVNQRADC